MRTYGEISILPRSNWVAIEGEREREEVREGGLEGERGSETLKEGDEGKNEIK